MSKRTLIEVVTTNTEDQLDKIGALRNVAVNDAWKRVRQKIQVKSWAEAEETLDEVINGLQKINMSKSLTPLLNKLKSAFKTPDQLIEDATPRGTPREPAVETPRETPIVTPKEIPKVIETDRKPDKQEIQEKPMSMQQVNELNKLRDGISDLEKFLRTALKKLDEADDDLQVPATIPDVLKPCMNVAIGICDKCKHGQREADSLRKQIADDETKYKDLEQVVKERDEVIQRLSETIKQLEKKNEERKEAKIETFKDQMKMKSFEKNLEQKTKEVDLLTKETKELKDRLNAIVEAQSADLADIGNPYPPTKLAEMYIDLFKTDWKDVMEVQKKSHKRGENEAITRLSGMLKDAYIHCKETSEEQLERLMEEFVYPCDDNGAMKGAQKLMFDISAQKQLNNLRKQTCTVSCEFAKNTLISQLENGADNRYTLQEISDCLPFIEKCVELCWFCVLQTPPIVVDTEFDSYKDREFDKIRYDPYSSDGKKIDVVVWPALYFENDGTVLAKGFAKAKK